MAHLTMGRQSDPEVELALELATMNQNLGALPGPGGFLQQDGYHIFLMKAGLQGLVAQEEQRRKEEERRRSH